MKIRKAFTMIELIFVIVILGIISSIAISKMAVTRDDAEMVKGRSQVASIRNAVMLTRNTNMLQAQGSAWPDRLDALATTTSADGDPLFGYDTIDANASKKLLDYPLYSKNANGHWRKVADNQYAFKVTNVDVDFTYGGANLGSFDCNHSITACKNLTE